MPADFASLERLDAKLAERGHHPLTDWWRGTLANFYNHPTARTLVARVGRGGAKSHTSTKVSLNEVLAGDWVVPPGERHFWAFVSINRDEAAQRLTLLERFLSDLGVPYDRQGDAIALRHLPRGWKVLACQVGSVSGFRCFGASLDELAKWRNADGANPAAEVSASIAAMTVTHPGARRLLISSPLGLLDHHAERFDLGDTAEQLTALAPSWVANPHAIAEADTVRLEPDPKVRSREYGAIPQASASAAFDPDAVARAFRPLPSCAYWPAIGVVDASSGGGDAFTYALARYVVPEHPYRGLVIFSNGVQIDPDTGAPLDMTPARPLFTLQWVASFEGRFKGHLTGDHIVSTISRAFRRAGVTHVIGDQRESLFLASAFAKERLVFREIPWTNENKAEAVRRIRRQLSEEVIVLPPERDKLKKELSAYAERITASGAITYSARGTGHDDEAALLITATMADMERMIPGSPLHQGFGRYETPGR